MRKRTKAREYALKILYQMEITKDNEKDSVKSFWERESETEGSVKDFTGQLVKGVTDNIKEIDAKISKYATNWQIDRMAVIDRNILRMATFEILYLDDIPPKVSINEAVDIAKKYGDNNSGKFVNGILDKINKMKTEK
ncbi:MAG: transcription antitermination factor NusB [Candidatus Omnitrophica bacterium]|nr:transcription antitermination factor NusB [Candidatus Omnitrophota bacterium]